MSAFVVAAAVPASLFVAQKPPGAGTPSATLEAWTIGSATKEAAMDDIVCIRDDSQQEVWTRELTSGNSTYVTAVRVNAVGEVTIVSLRVLRDGTVRPGPAGAVGFSAQEWAAIADATRKVHAFAGKTPLCRLGASLIGVLTFDLTNIFLSDGTCETCSELYGVIVEGVAILASGRAKPLEPEWVEEMRRLSHDFDLLSHDVVRTLASSILAP